jgi:hypothetical protein
MYEHVSLDSIQYHSKRSPKNTKDDTPPKL